jgi:hypothetical protein
MRKMMIHNCKVQAVKKLAGTLSYFLLAAALFKGAPEGDALVLSLGAIILLMGILSLWPLALQLHGYWVWKFHRCDDGSVRTAN